MEQAAPKAAAGAPAGAAQGVNLRTLLEEMIERDASDLHITAGERPKMRVDGDITNSRNEYVLTPKDTLQLAYSVLTENQGKTFDQLGLAPIISQLAERPRGLVLVTGPTGSGKSTTLAAMIDKVNKELKGP